MKHLTAATKAGIVLGLYALTCLVSGCVVTDRRDGYQQGYQEGYWDREHHRWWHEHSWVACGPDDEHCR